MKNTVVALIISVVTVIASIFVSMFIYDNIRYNTSDVDYSIANNVAAKRIYEYEDGTEFNSDDKELYLVTVEITNNTAINKTVTFPPFNIREDNKYFAECVRWDRYQGVGNNKNGQNILPGNTLAAQYYFEVRAGSELTLEYTPERNYEYDSENNIILEVDIER